MSEITNLQIWNKLIEIESLLKKSKSKPLEETISKSGTITIEKYTNGIYIKGDSYEKKAAIKKYSGYWSSDKKLWIITKKTKINGFIDEMKKTCENVNVIEKNTSLEVDTSTKVITVEKMPELNDTSFIQDD